MILLLILAFDVQIYNTTIIISDIIVEINHFILTLKRYEYLVFKCKIVWIVSHRRSIDILLRVFKER